MRTWTRYSKSGAGLFLGMMVVAGDGRAQGVTLVDAGTDQKNTAPAISVVAPSLDVVSAEGDAIQLHSSRVSGTTSFARALRASCGAAVGLDETKAEIERSLVRAIAARKGIDALEARRKKLEEEAVLAPRDGRIIAAITLATRDKKNIEESAKAEAKGKADLVSRELVALGGSLCAELCAGKDTAESPVDLCAFSSPVLANAAAIADFASVAALAGHVRRRLASIQLVLDNKNKISMADLASADPSLEARLPLFAVSRAASRVSLLGHTGLDVAGFSVGALDLGIRALASVILDRARREALVWFVERLHEDVCGPADLEGDASAEALREIRAHWLPTTCALAGKPLDFLQYGGGAELASALRGAIAADVRKWPAASLGLGLGASFWLDVKARGSLFACGAADVKGQTQIWASCQAEQDLRAAAAGLVTDIARGSNAALRLYDFGVDVDHLNVVAAGGARLASPRLEVAACAASIPLVFQQYGDLVRETRPGRSEETEALLLAALTTSPACFSMVGRGFSENDCPGLSESGAATGEVVCRRKDPSKPSDAGASPILALGAKVRLEKLSTITRWAGHVGAPARALETRWRSVVDAFDVYHRAAMRDAAGLSAQNKRLDVLAASSLLGRASLDLGSAFVKAGATAADPALFPGLCAGGGCDAAGFELVFAQAGEDLSRVSVGLDMLEALVSQDAGQVVARVFASLRPDLERLDPTADGRAACARGAGPCGVVSRLARYGGLFAALAFENDPARVAAALEAAATPVGGFRRKFVPGSFTVSLGAFPGLTSGFELRSGPYAGQRESFRTPYFVAPTLTMPVGFDFAKGYGDYNLGVFVSALDPAAYLQYDAEQNGQLPGARLLTVLAPGVWFRAGLFGSPFTLSAYSVFRPGLRAVESGFGATGAHALQLGLSASVDVTLFDLFTGPARSSP